MDCPGASLKLPGLQGAHEALLVAPVMNDAVPGGHCAQEAEAGLLEKAPEGHVKHEALDAEPVEGLYRPAAHCVHSSSELAPSLSPYRPEGHLTDNPSLLQ